MATEGEDWENADKEIQESKFQDEDKLEEKKKPEKVIIPRMTPICRLRKQKNPKFLKRRTSTRWRLNVKRSSCSLTRK